MTSTNGLSYSLRKIKRKNISMSRKRTRSQNIRKKSSVANVKMPRIDFVVMNLESITDLKEWTTLSYLFVLFGGAILGGVFLFFQPRIDRLIPVSCAIIGGALVFAGLFIEWRKFRSFPKRTSKGPTIGTLNYESDSLRSCSQGELTEKKVFKSIDRIFVVTEDHKCHKSKKNKRRSLNPTGTATSSPTS